MKQIFILNMPILKSVSLYHVQWSLMPRLIIPFIYFNYCVFYTKEMHILFLSSQLTS
jgi:hypothetical protein